MTAPAHALQLLDLVDGSAGKVAALRVTPSGDSYRGSIDLSASPGWLTELFEEFERTVEGQLFTAADEVEAELDAHCLRVVLPNGTDARAGSLQVYPTTGRVSLTLHPDPRAA